MIIPTHLLVKCRRTIPKLNFKGPYPSSEREVKFRRCLFTSSIKREKAFSRRGRAKPGKKCTKKVRGTCKVVVLLNKTYCFLDILAAVETLNLKVNENALVSKPRLSYNFPNLTYVLLLQ